MRKLQLSHGQHVTYVEMGTEGIIYRQRTTVIDEGRGHPAFSVVPSSAASILREVNNRIQAKRSWLSVATLAIWITVMVIVTSFLLIPLNPGAWIDNRPLADLLSYGVAVFGWVAGTFLVLRIRHKEKAARTTEIWYGLDKRSSTAFAAFNTSNLALSKVSRIWLEHSTPGNRGANTVNMGFRPCPHLNINAAIFSITVDRLRILFMPDRVLIFRDGAYQSIEYQQIRASVSTFTVQRYGATLPSDAHIVGHRWLHPRVDGRPDRRFKHNPQIPIVEYAALEIQPVLPASVGLIVSNAQTARRFAETLSVYQRYVTPNQNNFERHKSTHQQHEQRTDQSDRIWTPGEHSKSSRQQQEQPKQAYQQKQSQKEALREEIERLQREKQAYQQKQSQEEALRQEIERLRREKQAYQQKERQNEQEKQKVKEPKKVQDSYMVLGLPRTASREEITSAYRKMAQMYHPDKVASLGPELKEVAEKKMKEINTAYEQLKRTFE